MCYMCCSCVSKEINTLNKRTLQTKNIMKAPGYTKKKGESKSNNQCLQKNCDKLSKMLSKINKFPDKTITQIAKKGRSSCQILTLISLLLYTSGCSIFLFIIYFLLQFYGYTRETTMKWCFFYFKITCLFRRGCRIFIYTVYIRNPDSKNIWDVV